MHRQKAATGYAPLDTPKPVAENIWIVDGPVERCGRLPCPTRATVVRLGDGGLWIHAPTPLTDGLHARIDALGPVRHLIAPNAHHGTHIASWAAAYPNAICHALAGVDGTGETLAEDAPAHWSADIDQTIATGSRAHAEAVFFHRSSRTLILTDLIENIETARVAPHLRPLFWVLGSDDSDGKMRMTRRMSFRKAPLADAVERMIAWQPLRIVLAHGRCYERAATEELRRAFRRILRDREWTTAMDRIERDRMAGRD